MNKTTIMAFVFCLVGGAAFAQVRIDIDASTLGARISPMLYGIFFEDINHAADGGLYAELISNRSFEDNDSEAVGWTAADGATMTLTTKGLLNNAQGHALNVTFPGTVANSGFWGVNAVQGRCYTLTFWAKGTLKGVLKAYLQDAAGKVNYGEAVVAAAEETSSKALFTKHWTKYTAQIISLGNDAHARFALKSDSKGQLTIDVVSLFPPTFKGRENGMRPDLAEMLSSLRPRFMRFPGGCFVEGQESPDNAFRWERTIGPIEQRPGHLNRNWNYRTTDGMGFHEYLQLAEDLGAKPLYVVNVGIWHGGFTPVDSLQPWIDETMAALEYANGPVTSKYGAMRAENGHPDPFNIEYLEIGNENNQDNVRQQSDRYYDRFKKFKDAVLAKYPGMHLIGNVVAWGNDNPRWRSEEKAELLDEHYYRSPDWFAENYHKYDRYSRDGSHIYVGEYAVTQNFGTLGNLNAALGEAVFAMGMENNGDIVDMASYAPIFVNENNVAWLPDMIRFNSSKVMGTPSYYVQQMLSRNVGSRIVSSTMTNPYKDMAAPEVKAEQGCVGVSTWGTKAEYDNMTVNGGQEKISPEAFILDKGWTIDGGKLKQTEYSEGRLAILKKPAALSHYVYKVRARKTDGGEGFLIVFNYVDRNNYCWLNIGGWGNTSIGLEQFIDGAKSQIAGEQGTIETGRWYDIRVEVNGDSVKCFIDDKEVLTAELRDKAVGDGLFENAAVDYSTGDLIVKIVNTGRTATTAVINVANYAFSRAVLERLSGDSGVDENSLTTPTAIVPVEAPCLVSDGRVEIDVPAYSLNILRLKK